jgi:hypothetical protein
MLTRTLTRGSCVVWGYQALATSGVFPKVPPLSQHARGVETSRRVVLAGLVVVALVIDWFGADLADRWAWRVARQARIP